MKPKDLFSKEELERIKSTVREAEKVTSGEIRVKIISNCREGRNSKEEAILQFYEEGLNNTKDQTGVLILIILENKTIELLADHGINEKVSPNSWGNIVQKMSNSFKQGDFCKGLCDAVKEVGEHLKTHFPIKPDDTDELPDDVIVEK